MEMSSELPSGAHQRLEDALYRGLGRAVVLFSQLDLSISLCIQSLKTETDALVARKRGNSPKIKKKLEDLQKVIASKFKSSHPELVSDFDRWFSKASEIRQLRNDFIHGRWEISPVHKEICFVPGGALDSSRERRFQLSQFEGKIEGLASLFKEFWYLRDKYRKVGLW